MMALFIQGQRAGATEDKTVFRECFDLGSGDTNCSNDSSDSNDVNSNQNDWVDSDGGGFSDDDARIENEYAVVRTGDSITSPNISTTGLTNIHLEFKWGQNTDGDGGDDGSLVVEWKLAADATWTAVSGSPYALGSSNPDSLPVTQVNVGLPASAANASINLRFTGSTGEAGDEARIDDVVVSGDNIVQFTGTSANAAESTTAVSVPVSLAAAATVGTPATVNYTVSGTATGGGVDHNLANGTVTFTNPSTAQNINFTVINDELDENDETVIITLSSPNHSTLGGNTVFTYTIQDNDTAGVTVSALSGTTTTEAGAGSPRTFAINLNSQPTANVTIDVTSTDASEGAISGGSGAVAGGRQFTFTAANWATPQTVTVTGVNDDVDDGDQLYDVVVSATASTDPGYNGTFNPADFSGLTNTDDDTAGVTVSAISGNTTTEAAPHDPQTFSVRLDSQPLDDVTLSVSSDDTTEGTVDKATLTFTAANFATPQVVTVTGVDDGQDDGDVVYHVVLGATSSTDPLYNGIDPADFTLTNTDDDEIGFVVSAISTNDTTEAGGEATFTVRLGSQPADDVTIGVSSTDTSEGTVDAASLTFTSLNWSTPQTVTVTGQDDFADDGDILYDVVLAAAISGDGDYNGVDPADFSMTNLDDDSVAILVSPTADLTTTEAGGTDTFEVVLDSQPSDDVTIAVSTSDATEGTPDVSSLTFTPANWSAPQTVTVTGVDDFIDDGDIGYTIVLGAAVSTDSDYNGLDPDDAAVTNVDDDTAGFTVDPVLGLTTMETGATDTFTVVLTAEPTGNVTIGVASSDTTEGAADVTELVFTPANWNVAQTVTVSGANDDVDDGDIAYTIVTDAAVSTDAAFDGLNPANVGVTNTDDDTAGVTYGAISGATTTEAAPNSPQTFTVRLDSEPTDDVTIDFTSTDLTEGTVSPASVTFTAGDWNVAQTVTVTGANDGQDDGDVAYTVQTSAASSADPNYGGLFDSPDFAMTNIDDDSIAIVVSPTVGLFTTEAGGTATFTMVLDSQPTADVNILVSSALWSEGKVDPTDPQIVVFTPANWDVPQTVTVKGVNDNADDGDLAYTVVTNPASSADTDYNGLDPSNVTLINLDDDSAVAIVSAISGHTSETGTSQTFSVVLGAQPSAGVQITFQSDDETEGRITLGGFPVSTQTINFSPFDWNAPQIITVTGQDDLLDDGDITYTISAPCEDTPLPCTSGGMQSGDPKFDNKPVDSVTVVNDDNDNSGITVTPVSGHTTEVGGMATFTVVLNSQPTANVTIGLSSNDTTEGTALPSSLTFTPANWNTARTVTVTGVNDDIDDGDQVFMVVTAAAVSTDAAYSGLNALDRSVTNDDDDTAGVTVSTISGNTTTEAGAGTPQTFTLALNSEPTHDVTVDVTSSDVSEGTISGGGSAVAGGRRFTFTSANWNVAQPVTVTGANDAIDDDDQGYTVLVGATASTDPNYDGTFDPADASMTNTDDDTAGISVSPASGNTSEPDGTATFTVVLDSQPTADVTIGLSSNDPSEGTPSPSTVTFTSANWSTAQTVTVTGANDDIDDGDIAYMVITDDAVSSDPKYSGRSAVEVGLTNIDDDTAGITVTPTSGVSTTEGGATDTFTVVLNSEPTADVTIGISSSDTTEATVAPASLTFTPANWDVAQTVTATGINDDVDDGDIAFTVITAASTSGDANYDGINPANVAGTNQDNDTAGITVSTISGNTTEAGGTATFTIVLDSEPTDNVIVGLSSSDTTEGTVSPSSVTFTPADWATAQIVTVTGVNDDVDDGDVIYSIVTAAAGSGDDNYDGMNPANAAVTNTDDDSAGITVAPSSGLLTTEAGGTDTFTVVLTAEPTDNVTIGISSDDTTEGTALPSSLTFTPANWSVAQTVTVTGVNDDIDDGNVGFSIVTAAAASGDAGYDGLNAADVTATNQDNDSAGVVVTPTLGLETTELGGTDTFTVVLASEPTASVTIGLTSTDATEGTVAPASVTFTPADWDNAQTVTVTGVDDLVDDGDVAFTITTAAAVSADANYSGLNPANVSATNVDNDGVGISVTSVSGNTTEAGGTATFTVVLESEPTADVVIGLSSSDTGEGTVAPASLTFTSGNWDTAQTVTVTGVDDDVDDGNQVVTVVTAAATSADPLYNGVNAVDRLVTNVDDDTAGITASVASGHTAESGATATFTVVLDSEPTANVTVAVTSDDTGEGTAGPASLTFTPANWDTAQTVTVTGVDDDVDDGNIDFHVLTASTSSDPNYEGKTGADVDVTNDDDDTAGITVSAISGATTEAGGTATFTVVLDSEPTANVTVAVASDDAGEGVTDVASVTFTPANWDTAQTVTVTGQDDDVDDGNVAYSIVTDAAASADATYSGINAEDVSVTNNDNDSAGVTVSAVSGDTTEAGGSATFTVVLDSEPTGDVTIDLASNDTTEGTPFPASLTFTPGNWDTAQLVTVTGVDDNVEDGDQAYVVTTAPASSTDGNYSGLDAADRNLTNLDDDVAGITVSGISGDTTEAGGTATFTVVLNSQPTDDVTVDLTSDDTSEGTVSPSSVVFTPAAWNTAQTVTVTGVDDLLDDGDATFNVVTAAAASSDGNYAGIDPADVAVTNIDDDGVGIVASAISGNTTEAGGTATFSVRLNSEPTDDVEIDVSSDDTTEGTVSPTTLTFTALNWNIAQIVTVTGLDDASDDGNVVFNVVIAPASSDDAAYDGLNADDVSVTNLDNDTAGVTVSMVSGNTTELGGTATLTVVLTSQPSSSVTIGVSSSDATEGTVSPGSLVFTPANWNVARTVTVTGVDDAVDDGDISYSVVTAPAVSGDGQYNGMNAVDRTLSNIDDDITILFEDAVVGMSPLRRYTRTRDLNIKVTGSGGAIAYLVSESPRTPSANDPRWTSTPPTKFKLSNTDGLHTIYAWAKNGAGKLSKFVKRSTTLDRKTPTTQITAPANRASIDKLTSITGTSVDPGYPTKGSGVARVLVSVRREVGSNCFFWTGRAWVKKGCEARVWLRFKIGTDGKWSFNRGFSRANFDKPGTYSVFARTVDFAHNVASPTKFTLGKNWIRFTVK